MATLWGFESLPRHQISLERVPPHDRLLAVGAEELERCVPVYDELAGWQESTVGVKTYEGLPKAARKYLRRIEELCAVPADIISTGPDRDETIVMRHPFDA